MVEPFLEGLGWSVLMTNEKMGPHNPLTGKIKAVPGTETLCHLGRPQFL